MRPFNEDGVANSFGVNDLTKRGFHVCTDSAKENCVFAEKDNVVRKFIASNGGSHFNDSWNDDLCFKKSNNGISIKNDIFMQSQKEKSKWCTKQQMNKAKRGMEFTSNDDVFKCIRF